ncbi:bifunctional lysylphosphatidylglycerol flippase/synthetase MprF [Solimonas marina]|uniref:Phosphatidylglycerol lysyltransferase n=1 Tax=Solimonas marina TaxID=2714601 RepID=A0A969WCG2_9GAMM|nr:bifunctional lysylphosphatidylglycerol flippase/synthetase MprF [Solimonas marina]NKF24662.1 bifunctional lysylphosphatidylglycerol flippase/synthetase MprF [Solimonas marina]
MSDSPVPPPAPAAAPPPSLHWSRLRTALTVVGAILLTALILYALQRLTREVQYDEMVAAIRNTNGLRIFLAILATAASFVALSGYDFSSLRYVGARVKPQVVMLTSFIAYALGNTVGLGVLTGGAVRMRMYSAAGVETPQVGRAIAFNALAFGIGISTLGALGLLWGAKQVASVVALSPNLLRTIAMVVLMAVAAFLTLCAARPELPLGPKLTLRLPSAKLAMQQLGISVVELVFSATALWFLMPQHATIGFPGFLAYYAIGIALGIISHVPGGLGVFEATMLLAYRGDLPVDRLAGALVLYRGVYYLLPLLVAVATLAVVELRSGVVAPVTRAAARLSPLLLSAFTLVIGVMLLVSGVTPASDAALELLELKVPLPLVEASHFLGSIFGLIYLFLARGMLHRLDAAWWAALVVTIASFILALPKGLAIGEMTLLAFLFVTLLATRREFYRRASLLAQGFSLPWFLAVGCLVAGVFWILFFVYRDVPYGSEMWWQFAFDARAPRALRAATGISVLLLAFASWQLLRPTSGRMARPSDDELARAQVIARRQPRAEAVLASTGDKGLLFSASGNAFLMYGKHGRSWVALFDPVGPLKEWPELIWRFIEMASTHGGRAAFYQIRPQSLPVYLDAGLRALKLGEYAAVPLPDFTLKGSARANLRHGASRGEREGLTFEWREGEDIREWLPALRPVSEAWMAEHEAREKSFSLGRFDARYLCAGGVAIARHGERIVAFLSVQITEQRIDSVVDLMRYVPDAPKGTMDFLFARTLTHLQSLGYQSFGLGMAPMSGMIDHPLASRWHRFGRMLFAHGEQFYNFRGLRAFKEKFAPEWEPRYLVAPGGAAPLLALTDIAALISGGFKGVISK